MALEPEFWAELDRMAKAREISLAALIRAIDDERAPDENLTSLLRLAVLKDLKAD